MSDKFYNLNKLSEIAQDDQGFIREMLVTFVENVTIDIGNVQSFKSMANWTAVAETAHKLASNFAYMGANSIHAVAADIERSVLQNHDLTGIEDKTDKMCNSGVLLVEQLRNDFNLVNVD